MRHINKVVCHYTDSPDVSIDTVRQWHLGRGWKDVGYHLLVRRDGSIEQGRPESEIGAHTAGFNKDSLGVALTGSNRLKWYPAQAQLESLKKVLANWKRKYNTTVYFHCDLNATSCPGRLRKDQIEDMEELDMFAYQLDVNESKTGYQITGAVTGEVAGKNGHVFLNARALKSIEAKVDVWVWSKTEKKRLDPLILKDGKPADRKIIEGDIKGSFAIQLIPKDDNLLIPGYGEKIFISVTQWIK